MVISITGLADHAVQQQEEADSRGLQLAKDIAQVCCHNVAEGIKAMMRVSLLLPCRNVADEHPA